LKNATTYTYLQKLLIAPAMHAAISLLLQSRQLWWYLLLFFDAASRCHNDVIQFLPVYSAC